MSDHDTFDIDRAFESLTRDVGSVATSPGARGAIDSVRRRRLGTLGLAAATVATAGGLALGGLPGGDQVAPPPATDGIDAPADPPTDPVIPEPLIAVVLQAATSPWISGWEEGESPVLTDAPCVGDNLPEPLANDSAQFRGAPEVGAERIYSTWRSEEVASRVADRLNESLASCALERRSDGALIPPNVALEPGGPGARLTIHESRDGGSVTWVAEWGRRVGLLTIAGGGAPPPPVQERVGEALVAGLAYDEAD